MNVVERSGYHEVVAKRIPDDAKRILPLIGNDEIKLLLDARGAMHDFRPDSEMMQTSSWPVPRIVWAGRRHNRRVDEYSSNLFEWGFLDVRLVGEEELGKVTGWQQKLMPREGLLKTTIRRDKITEDHTSFVHLEKNLIVLHRTFHGLPKGKKWRVRAVWTFCRNDPEQIPFHTTWQPLEAWEHGIAADTTADGIRVYHGHVALFSDHPVQARAVKNRLEFETPLADDGAATVFLSFADDLGNDPQMVEVLSGEWMSLAVQEINRELREMPRRQGDPAKATRSLTNWVVKRGYKRVLATHKKAWARFWKNVQVQLPPQEQQLAAALETQLYALRCTWTRWSMPPTPFNSAWGAGYFNDDGWGIDGLLGMGLTELPLVTLEWRRRCLPFSVMMTAGSGARIPNSANESGAMISERNHQGFDQFTHLGQIAKYVYDFCRFHDDAETWRRYYPLLREIAEFYRNWLIVELPGNNMMITWTGCEGEYPIQDQQATLSGAVPVMYIAAELARKLKVDQKLAQTWKHLGDLALLTIHHQYVEPAQRQGEAVPKLSWYVEYELADLPLPKLKVDTSVADWRRQHKQKVNPPTRTDNTCGEKSIEKFWAWGHFDEAYREATLEHPEKALQALREAFTTVMDFSALNESVKLDAKGRMELIQHPWFATAAGAFVRALTRMLVYPKDDEIILLPGIPEEWQEFSFTLPVHRGGWVTVVVDNGRLTSVRLREDSSACERLIHLPRRFLAEQPSFTDGVTVREQDSRQVTVDVATRQGGDTELLANPPR